MAKKSPTHSLTAPPTAGTVEDTGIVRANVNRNLIVSPTFVSLYANDVQVQTTPWDIRLILGEIHGVPTVESPNVTVRQIAELRLSPQLTKKVVAILIGQLRTYETNFGTIPVPED